MKEITDKVKEMLKLREITKIMLSEDFRDKQTDIRR